MEKSDRSKTQTCEPMLDIARIQADTNRHHTDFFLYHGTVQGWRAPGPSEGARPRGTLENSWAFPCEGQWPASPCSGPAGTSGDEAGVRQDTRSERGQCESRRGREQVHWP